MMIYCPDCHHLYSSHWDGKGCIINHCSCTRGEKEAMTVKVPEPPKEPEFDFVLESREVSWRGDKDAWGDCHAKFEPNIYKEFDEYPTIKKLVEHFPDGTKFEFRRKKKRRSRSATRT